MGRSMVRGSIVVCFVAVSALVAGCGTSATSATSPASVFTTENFSGTFTQSGTDVHSFTVSATGAVTVSLTSIGPLSTMSLGVGIGTWDGSNCNLITQNPDARLGSTALSGTANTGNYCVRVYDSGNVPADWTVSYAVQVVHP